MITKTKCVVCVCDWPLLLKRKRLTKELYADRRGGSSSSGVRGLKWVRWEGLAGERTGGSLFQSGEDGSEASWPGPPVAMLLPPLPQEGETHQREIKVLGRLAVACQALPPPTSKFICWNVVYSCSCLWKIAHRYKTVSVLQCFYVAL